jgi:anti-anti-sigma regulatory factor/HAMP domain-containing protein
MSLSAKLSAAYAVLVMVVASVLTFTLYVESGQAQRTVIHDHLRDIISFTDTQIDADFHTLIVSPGDEQSSYYRIIKEKLQQIQQTSSAIKHIYTLRKQSDGQIVFVVDNGTPSRAVAPIGTKIDTITPLLTASVEMLRQPVIGDDLVTDPEGYVLLYGYGPIVDQFGRQDGLVAIELDASVIIDSEVRARNTALIVFFVALPLVLIIGIWLVRRLTSPVAELVKGAERIAHGQLDYRVQVNSGDELGVLAATFNAMTDTLQARIVAEQQAQRDLSQSHQQLQAYNRSLEQAMQEQQRLSETVRQLSLPVIPIANQIIMVPLVGAVDSGRAEDFIETVLRGVEQHRARVVLLDLTGVLLLDALVAQALIKAITAARLLGAHVLMLGIRPELAETFINVGVDVSLFETSATMQSGLLRALSLTGVRVTALS